MGLVERFRARAPRPAQSPRIAVIGGAAGGACMLLAVASHASSYSQARFVLYERSPVPWWGPAHSTLSTALRVNMRPELHDLPNFIPFLEACRLMGWDSQQLPVRYLLARYIGMAFDCARTRLELEGASIELVRDEVCRILRRADSYSVIARRTATREFDFVVLALGNNPPSVSGALLLGENQNAVA
jgi:uncharacterized NAD(P)/FAD-binding protein YdhS